MVIFESEKVNKIISEAYTQGVKLSDIANQLASEGLTTKYGKGWTGASVSSYAHKKLGLSNREVHIKNQINKACDNFPEHKEYIEPIVLEQQEQAKNFDDLVFEKDGKLFTTSKKLAEMFDKEHKDVLESIRNLINSGEEGLPNFPLSSYFNSQNKEQPMFLLCRDGFSMLAMGFTGPKALKFKIAYIKQFNKMEESLKQPIKMLTTAEQIQAQANLLVEHDRSIKALDSKVGNLESRIKELFVLKETREVNNSSLFAPEFANIETFELFKDDRTKLNNLVKSFAKLSNVDVQSAWTYLYKEFKDYFKVDLQLQAVFYNKNKEVKFHKKPIDIADEKGYIPLLYKLITKLYQDKECSLGLQVKES
jgi:Rha family phage regulatory protein